MVVTTADRQHFEANKVIICNGHDFRILFPEVFRSIPIEQVKLQMMVTHPVREKITGNLLTGMTIRRYESFKSCDAYRFLSAENSHPELAEKGIHLLFKQRPDGAIVIGDSHVYADVQDGFDSGFEENQYINNLIMTEARRILQLEKPEISACWSGYYAQMKDDSEIFDHTIDNDVHIITGIGGKGMTAGAGFAQEKIKQLFG